MLTNFTLVFNEQNDYWRFQKLLPTTFTFVTYDPSNIIERNLWKTLVDVKRQTMFYPMEWNIKNFYTYCKILDVENNVF